MNNYIQPGNTVDFVAPSNVTSGVPFVVGPAGSKLVLVPVTSAVSGALVACAVEGVVELPKQGGDDFVSGETCFWDDNSKLVEKTGTGFIPFAVAVETTGDGATSVKVKLFGRPGTPVSG